MFSSAGLFKCDHHMFQLFQRKRKNGSWWNVRNAVQVISRRTRERYCSGAQPFWGRTSCFKLLTLWRNCLTALSHGIRTDCFPIGFGHIGSHDATWGIQHKAQWKLNCTCFANKEVLCICFWLANHYFDHVAQIVVQSLSSFWHVIGCYDSYCQNSVQTETLFIYSIIYYILYIYSSARPEQLASGRDEEYSFFEFQSLDSTSDSWHVQFHFLLGIKCFYLSSSAMSRTFICALQFEYYSFYQSSEPIHTWTLDSETES